ncbi:ornithine cyclodeaminase family protein [Roseibium album]|uniref:Ectoine utilization protein EutC n=1 Tax=Roseibium album TaxID=311410 RepID=A0A0M6ZZY1_9HYPH|nr:ornithine cyclodeaminase family protein [Roseibium album]CTQ61245.1 ectoine utilization protein EutC [Roseibium album]CTQ67776.1 ectoine utilization protein EutC [Roseibium album]CTQ79011.1 ectoine utilization protein EutC [Roseibium album]
MKYVPEEVSSRLATHELAYEAVRNALIAAADRETATFPVVIGHGSDPNNVYAIKSCAVAEIAGLKIGSYWPGNDRLGVPRHNSIIFLFDQDTGRIGAAVEAGHLNAFRTAAADAVAAEILARKDASTLAIFGAGHQAGFEVQALSRIRGITHVLVVARNREKGARFADGLRRGGLEASVCSAEEACRRADIVVTATPSCEPLFEADWVKPGSHVASMGSDTSGKQELPPGLFENASLFCDLPGQSRSIGEFQHAAENLYLAAIGDVLCGRAPGRTDDDEITIFDSSGLSVQDLYVARTVLELVEREQS